MMNPMNLMQMMGKGGMGGGNPMQMISQMMKGGGNTQSMIMDMIKKQAGDNPIMNNAIQMMEKGDKEGVEKLVRNVCQEKGINPDDAMKQIMSQFGMK